MRTIKTICILLLFHSLSYAQLVLPEYIMTKYDAGELKVRWEPASISEWKQSISKGFIVELFDSTLPTTPLASSMVLPSRFDEFKKVCGEITNFKAPFFEGTMKLLYPDKSKNKEDKIESYFGNETSEAIDSLRLGYIIYSSIYDFNLTKMAGLGTSFKVRQGVNYRIKISTPGFEPRWKEVVTILNEPKIMDLTGEWGDKEVKLKWNSYQGKKDFFGYYVERSEDGFKFKLRDSIPWVNANDKKNGVVPSPLHYLEKKDSLSENYKNFYFRLRGLDYFGSVSSKYSMIVGHGYEKITLSPFITYADQTEENFAHIKWITSGVEDQTIARFELLRSDSLNGEYLPVLKNIDHSIREIKTLMTNNINYYRIEAFAKEGQGLSSNAVLVMGQDNEAPSKAEIIGAILDTLNRAVIKWKKNNESDLWGYRIFKSNFKSDEFTLLNAYPTLDTVFYDTLNVNIGIKDVFYLVEVADKRNNRSPLSDTIRIELPDRIAPQAPMISELNQEGDSLKVYYAKSGSDDAIAHTIYRREFDKRGWTILAEIPNQKLNEYIIDTTVSANTHYAYTITARDKHGNESEPTFYKDILVSEKNKDFIPFIKIEKTMDEKNKKVTISWVCNPEKKLKYVLIYRGSSEKDLGKYKMVDVPALSFEDNLKDKKGTMTYVLKPIFENQDMTYLSEPILVDCTFSKKL